MAYEHFSFDIGENLGKEKKAKEQIEEQKKAEELLERKKAGEKKEKEQTKAKEEKEQSEINEEKKQSETKKEKEQPETKEEKKQSGFKEEKKSETRAHIKDFLNKYNKLIVIALIIFLILINFYIRAFAMGVPGIDLVVEEGFSKNLKANIAADIAKGHVGPVDPVILQKETEQRFKEITEDPKTKIVLQKLIAEYKEEYFDSNGNLYFANFDPLLYLRYTRNILKRGSMGESIKDGTQFDNLRNAPHGAPVAMNLLPYYEAFFYKIMHFFNSEVKLEYIALKVPLIFSSLSIIIVFFILKRLTNNYGGFVGGLLFAIHPIIFEAMTSVDTQVPSIFFTLLTVWLAIEITDAKLLSKRFWILLAALLATLVLYKYTWTGYYYIYAIIASYVMLYLFLVFIRNRLRKEKINKKYLLGLSALVLAVIAYLIIKPGIIQYTFSILKVGEDTGFFPTAFSMVMELRKITLLALIQKVSGYALFAAACLVLVYLIYSAFKNKLEGDAKHNLFIAYWFIGLLIVSLLAQRFTAYFSIPFILCIGIGAGLLYTLFEKMPAALGLHEYRKYLKPVLAILLILLIAFLIRAPLEKRIYSTPTTVDDALYETAIDIKENSRAGAIINMWWDDGYLYEYYAERPVLFDGGSFNSPALYWIAKAFTSTNANYSMNVFRMLDCGASTAFDEIAAKKGKPEAIDIMNDILEAGKEKSKKIIQEEKLDAGLLDRIFCKPPEAFIVTSETMTKLFKFYEQIAGTDFKARELKAKIQGMDSKEAISFLSKKYNLSIEDAYDLYGRIYSDNSNIPLKVEFFDTPCVVKKESINCMGLVLNNKTGVAKDAKDTVYPYYLVTNESITKKLDVDNAVTLIFYQDQDLMKIAAVNSEIRDSFIIKLYFLDAQGISQLKLISSHSSIVGNKVKAYKINWTG